MPLVHISLQEGKSPEYIQALADGIHEALCTAWEIPQNDRFQIIHEHRSTHFLIDKKMWDINRSDNVIVIYIISISRSTEMKVKFYKEVVKILKKKPGIREEDVFISILHNEKDCWSFGNGIAQLIASSINGK